MHTWSRPDISRHLPISARYILPTSGCCRGRHLPISGRHLASRFSDIGMTPSLYRPDVGLISLTTSGRHRAHVQTWSRPDISRHLPISARYNFRHQADVVADICRYRADIWLIVLIYLVIQLQVNIREQYNVPPQNAGEHRLPVTPYIARSPVVDAQERTGLLRLLQCTCPG